jgi:hypothetical protein
MNKNSILSVLQIYIYFYSITTQDKMQSEQSYFKIQKQHYFYFRRYILQWMHLK